MKLGIAFFQIIFMISSFCLKVSADPRKTIAMQENLCAQLKEDIKKNTGIFNDVVKLASSEYEKLVDKQRTDYQRCRTSLDRMKSDLKASAIKKADPICGTPATKPCEPKIVLNPSPVPKSKTKSAPANSVPKSLTKSEAKSNPIVVAPSEVAPPAGDTPLEVCIQNFDRQVSSCVNDAEEANIKCDERLAEDSEMASVRKTASEISNGAFKNAIGARAGSGAADQCAQIAMLGNTATLALNAFKENCDEIYSGCIDKCKTVREALDDGTAFDTCKRELSSAPAEIDNFPAEEYLTKQIDRLKNTYNEGDLVCTKAGKKHDYANQLMRSLGDSTRAAKSCQCKLAASNQQGGGGYDPAVCEQGIPNPADCLPGAALAGSPACNIYANDDCTLGSGKYNSIPCQCARDNSASVCRSVAGKPVPSNFAMDLKSGSVAVGAGGGFGDGGDSGGNLNLGGGYDIKKPFSELKPADADTGGGGYAGGAGSGPGGGGSGGGSGEDSGALVEEDDGSDKGGLPGLFNQVKTSMGDLFGLKNKSGKTAGSPGGKGSRAAGYDIKDWIPRGVAGAGCQISQMRCKNEDIFSIMNQRYDKIENTFTDLP